MMLSYEDIERVLNGDRDFDIQIETEKQCATIIDSIFFIYQKYLLWTYEEFESAVEYIENLYEDRQTYLNTTYQGIFERMKEHSSEHKESYGEFLVRHALQDENYTFKKECYIGHSLEEGSSIKLDFVVFHNDILYVIEFNGEQHYRPVEKFGGEEQFVIQQQNDEKKREFCKRYNIPLLEIPYTIRDKEKIKEIIKGFIK